MVLPDIRTALRLVALCASGLAFEPAWANLAPNAPPSGSGAAPQSTVLVASPAPAPASTAAEKQAWKSDRIEAANFKKFVRQFGAESLDEGALLRAKSAWLWYRLTYPTGTLPSDPWGRAAEHIRRYVVDAEPWPLEGAPLLPPESMPPSAVVEPELNTWVEFGPRPLDSTGTTNNAYQYGIVAGRLNVVVSDPTNRGAGAGDRAWLGFAAGGLWRVDGIRSVDCSVSPCDVTGVTATPMWDGLIASTQGVSAIEIDPDDSSGDTVYVGTGDWQANDQFSAGILKTDRRRRHLDAARRRRVFTPFSNLVPPDQATAAASAASATAGRTRTSRSIAGRSATIAQRILVGHPLRPLHVARRRREPGRSATSAAATPTRRGRSARSPASTGSAASTSTARRRRRASTSRWATSRRRTTSDNGVYRLRHARRAAARPGPATSPPYFDGLPATRGTAAGCAHRPDRARRARRRRRLPDALRPGRRTRRPTRRADCRPRYLRAAAGRSGLAHADATRRSRTGASHRQRTRRPTSTAPAAASGTGQDWYDLFIRASIRATDQTVYIGHIDAFKTQINASYTALGLSSARTSPTSTARPAPPYGKVHPDQHGFAFVEPGDRVRRLDPARQRRRRSTYNTDAAARPTVEAARRAWSAPTSSTPVRSAWTSATSTTTARAASERRQQWLFGGMQDNGNASWDSSRPDLPVDRRAATGGDGFFTAFDSLGGTRVRRLLDLPSTPTATCPARRRAPTVRSPASLRPDAYGGESPDWSRRS